jgi:hypothetical protein
MGPGRSQERDAPAYDLVDVRDAFERGHFRVTLRVQRHLWAKGWDRDMVRSCIVGLRTGSFHKSQECAANPEAWLDVYRPQWTGERWYVKFVREEEGGGYRVLTFCRDGEQH